MRVAGRRRRSRAGEEAGAARAGASKHGRRQPVNMANMSALGKVGKWGARTAADIIY